MPKPSKHQCYSLLYYEENLHLLNALFDWCELNGHSYYAIKHDKDYYQDTTFDDNQNLLGTNGDKKQNHYHAFVYLKYPILDSDFVKKINYQTRFVKSFKPKNLDDKILYLTHARTLQNYEIQDIITNRKDYVEFVYSQFDNSPRIFTLFDYLDDYLVLSKKVSYYGFLKYLREKQINDSDIKRYWSICKDIIYENHFKKKEVVNSRDDIFESKLNKLFPNIKFEQGQLELDKGVIKLNETICK